MKNTRVANSLSALLLLWALFQVSCTESGGAAQSTADAENRHAPAIPVSEREKLSATDYIDWVEHKDNGLFVKKHLNDVIFSCLYKPTGYEALLRMRRDTFSEDKFRSIKNDLHTMQFFTLKVATADNKGELLKFALTNTDEYYRRIEYCSFRMQDDIKLIDNGDTLDCVLFHFERVFGVAPEATFVLGFEDNRTRQKKDAELYDTGKTLSIEDGIFGLGKINLGIGYEALNSIPDIDTKSIN